jgi:general secretion pathway protein J
VKAVDRCPNAGFVLVEGLVTLMLVTMTVSLFATMLTFGRRVSDAGRLRQQLVDMATGTDALAGWLAGAVALREAPRPDAKVLFDGGGRRLSFVAASQGDVQRGGLMVVTVAFEGGALVFDVAPIALGSVSLPNPGPRHALWTDVTSLTFSYFGSTAEGAPAQWQDEWRDAARLPRLVAVRAALAMESRVERVSLTFRIVSE